MVNAVGTAAVWIASPVRLEHVAAYGVVILRNGLAFLARLDGVLRRVLLIGLNLLACILPAEFGALVFPAVAVIHENMPRVARRSAPHGRTLCARYVSVCRVP